GAGPAGRAPDRFSLCGEDCCSPDRALQSPEIPVAIRGRNPREKAQQQSSPHNYRFWGKKKRPEREALRTTDMRNHSVCPRTCGVKPPRKKISCCDTLAGFSGYFVVSQYVKC